MSRITSIALGLIAMREALASPVAEVHRALITAAPELIRRDFAPNFVGYALEDNSIDLDTYTCNSQLTYTSSRGYGGCVPTTNGNQYIGQKCGANWLTLANSASVSCNNYCVTNSIFLSTNDGSPATNVVCASKSTGIIILRTSVTDTRSLSGFSTPAVTSKPSATSSSMSGSTSKSASTTSPTTTPTIVPVVKGHHVSGAVIGGAVAGGLVLVGLIALGIFFFCRKRSRDRKNKNANNFGGPNHPPVVMPPPHGVPPMHQGYATPVGVQTMYPNQYVPGSAPPFYSQEKNAHVAAMATPVSPGYGYPEGAAEVEGISSPVPHNQAPRTGTSELG